jgi:hypothetical protein
VKVVTVSQHYSRPTRKLSSRLVLLSLTGLGLLAANIGYAQYPGQVSKKPDDKAPGMRAVAVLEWTGDPGKPTASRIVPVSIYDGERLQDASLYLARPWPLAVSYATEYELKRDGRTVGLFEVKNAGHMFGSWVGFGNWKPLPKPKTAAAAPPKIDEDWESDDKPVLHRKHKAGDSSANSGSSTPASTPDSRQTSSQEDSDRPKLHKKTDDSTGSDSGSSSDPDHPTLHKKTSDDASATSAGSAPVDPDRPTMTKPKPRPAQAQVDSQAVASLPPDPDRPRLKRGSGKAGTGSVEPTLMGLPDDMKQAVAVSDLRNGPEHLWTYSWANPDDESKMKSQLEDLARQALGISQPPASKAKSATAHHSTALKKAVSAPPPAEPAELEGEQFRVFELAYGSGATMVLSAHTPGPPSDRKFVTLIAQPDLYGNVLVLMKNVTDTAHLDETPRMSLVDPVDALADNRGELLFELRGDTIRQFALYRVLRGRADKLFTTFGSDFGSSVVQ